VAKRGAEVSRRAFTDHIDTIREAHPDAPGQLDMELTEGVLRRNPEHSKTVMETLASRGMNLCLDDFGTGYASLGHLKHLPLQTLKIDRSFTQEIVSSPQQRAIVGPTINVANGLNLGVVAEGIESEEQLRVMSELGCREFQGDFFSRPIPADDATSRKAHFTWCHRPTPATHPVSECQYPATGILLQNRVHSPHRSLEGKFHVWLDFFHVDARQGTS